MKRKRGRPTKIKSENIGTLDQPEYVGSHIGITKDAAIKLWPWLSDCEFEGGSFYVMSSSYGPVPQYELGTWKNGEWQYGTMVRCEFHNGVMRAHRSYFEEGNWFNGTFEGFLMKKTNWYNGIFNGGYFTNSNFFNGEFRHGIFFDSWWHEGLWGDYCRVRSTSGRKIVSLDHIPRKMMIRKRKVHGKDLRDLQSESIQPRIKVKKVKEPNPIKEKKIKKTKKIKSKKVKQMW